MLHLKKCLNFSTQRSVKKVQTQPLCYVNTAFWVEATQQQWLGLFLLDPMHFISIQVFFTYICSFKRAFM